jgi:hypothetical protein
MGQQLLIQVEVMSGDRRQGRHGLDSGSGEGGQGGSLFAPREGFCSRPDDDV